MASAERVCIFIDGSNFYQRLREFGLRKGTRLDYTALVDFLLRSRTLVSKNYYVGIVRNHDHSPESQRLVESQQKFLAGLEAEGFLIKRGRIVYDHKIREKGVDVEIATDLLIGAVDDLYDTAVIVSSDTDLIPAIKYIRGSKAKKIEYVGFSARPSLGMISECNLNVLLLPEDIQRLTN